LTLKVPEDRSIGASLVTGISARRSKESRPRERRTPSAFSTFDQDVFWARIAPRHTSKAVSPGHQPAWPYRPRRRSYT
jgi:hypothetical protein